MRPNAERVRFHAPIRWRQWLRHCLAIILPRRVYMVRGPTGTDSVCLTFDDGPDPVHTPRLLDSLKENGVRATFFVIGQRAQRHPEIIQRMMEDGHEIGNHSYSHGDPASTSARIYLEDARQCDEVLRAITGQAPRLCRPPNGKLTAAKAWGLWLRKQTIVLWNVDPKDYACRSDTEIREWFERNPLRGGDLVLMHDDRPLTAAALPALLALWRTQGVRFVTVADWLSPGRHRASSSP